MTPWTSSCRTCATRRRCEFCAVVGVGRFARPEEASLSSDSEAGRRARRPRTLARRQPTSSHLFTRLRSITGGVPSRAPGGARRLRRGGPGVPRRRARGDARRAQRAAAAGDVRPARRGRRVRQPLRLALPTREAAHVRQAPGRHRPGRAGEPASFLGVGMRERECARGLALGVGRRAIRKPGRQSAPRTNCLLVARAQQLRVTCRPLLHAASQAAPLFHELLKRALALVEGCPCRLTKGCPMCTQHISCKNYNAVRDCAHVSSPSCCAPPPRAGWARSRRGPEHTAPHRCHHAASGGGETALLLRPATGADAAGALGTSCKAWCSLVARRVRLGRCCTSRRVCWCCARAWSSSGTTRRASRGSGAAGALPWPRRRPAGRGRARRPCRGWAAGRRR